MPFCHLLTLSNSLPLPVYPLPPSLPLLPSISMLKYQQARICHSGGPLILFCCFEESTWKDNNRVSPKSSVADWLYPPQQTHSWRMAFYNACRDCLNGRYVCVLLYGVIFTAKCGNSFCRAGQYDQKNLNNDNMFCFL